MVSKWKTRDLLQVVQQGRGWWASLGYTQHHPPGVAEHSFHKSSSRLSQKKLWYADSLIWLVAGIKTMQCTNAGLYQGADKTRGVEEQAAGKGLAKGRHPPQGKHRKAEGGCFVLKIATYALFLLVLSWMMSWGAVGAVSIPGDKARLGTPATQWVLLCRFYTETLTLPHLGAEPRKTPWLADHFSSHSLCFCKAQWEDGESKSGEGWLCQHVLFPWHK